MATSLKYISVVYDAGGPGDTPLQMIRSYSDVVADASKIAVSHNGQRIRLHTAETISSANSFAKYFYELANVGAATFTVTIKANQFYRDAGLNITEPTTAYSILDTDIFYIEYEYTIA